MHSITDVIIHFKQNWTEELSEGAIAPACHEAGMTWRETLLNPVMTLQPISGTGLCASFARQYGHRTSFAPDSSVVHCLCLLSSENASPARSALRLTPAKRWEVAARNVRDGPLARAPGVSYRWIEFLDVRYAATSGPFWATRSAESRLWQCTKPGPVAHWLVMMHAGTGMITKMLAAPLRTHEMSKTVELHPELHAGDLLVADRGFCSYVHLALLLLREGRGLLRIHQRAIVDFTPGRPQAAPGRGKASKQKGMPRSRWIKETKESEPNGTYLSLNC